MSSSSNENQREGEEVIQLYHHDKLLFKSLPFQLSLTAPCSVITRLNQIFCFLSILTRHHFFPLLIYIKHKRKEKRISVDKELFVWKPRSIQLNIGWVRQVIKECGDVVLAPLVMTHAELSQTYSFVFVNLAKFTSLYSTCRVQQEVWLPDKKQTMKAAFKSTMIVSQNIKLQEEAFQQGMKNIIDLWRRMGTMDYTDDFKVLDGLIYHTPAGQPIQPEQLQDDGDDVNQPKTSLPPPLDSSSNDLFENSSDTESCEDDDSLSTEY